MQTAFHLPFLFNLEGDDHHNKIACLLQGHTTCVTEHDKYARGATKPGGYAADGYYANSEAAQGKELASVTGLEYLSERPPWACSICNVTCTSRETLLGHASGAKHKRRVRPVLSLPPQLLHAATVSAGQLRPPGLHEDPIWTHLVCLCMAGKGDSFSR